MLNQCVLVGNLGADPEMSYSSEGMAIASFSLAFRAAKEETGWIRVVCFGRLAEVVEQYLHKGARVGVAGSLDQRRWQNETGFPRVAWRILANCIEFIKTDGRGFEEGKAEPAAAVNRHPAGEGEEDLPF